MVEYIHQLEEWPELRCSLALLEEQLGSVRHRQGRLIGRMETLGFQLRAEALLKTLTEDVLKSSEIENEILDEDQVRSSIARRLGMDIGALAVADRNVEGVVEMILDATQRYDQPLTEDRLFAWHAALFPTGRSGMSKITVGAWRTEASGPMQVVSGPMGRKQVHYEAPVADRLLSEMAEFLAWFNDGPALDPVLKAGVAHLWFVTIHPFEDGNGRIARAIADMALARSEASPQRFYSMSAQIRAERKAYYDILEATQKGDLDITSWLQWFLGCLDRAFGGAETILANVLRKARFWEALAAQPLNDRQRKVINRLLDGFEGKLTSSKWAILAKCSQDTASRDIDDLIRRRVLVRDPAGGRSTSYTLVVAPSDALRAVVAYARAHAHRSVWNGPVMPTPDEAARRQGAIEDLANQIDALAERADVEPVTYQMFDPLLRAIHEQRFHPEPQLVSAVAFALERFHSA